MPTDRTPPPGHWGRQVAVGAAVAVVWAVLAWARPTTTWHLAPLLVVGGPAVEPRAARPASAAALRPAGSVAIGAVLALMTTALLHVAGVLAGPALVGPVAWVEAVLLVAVGATGAVGWILWTAGS